MDKVEMAVNRLKEAEKMSEAVYGQPLVVTMSGGKDSSVCVELALEAGINFEVVHSHTTADAPETVRFVRQEFKRLEDNGVPCWIEYPYYKGKRTSMWSLIPEKKLPPMRTARYCCEVLKEQTAKSRFIATGVRWKESIKRRQSRGIYETIAKNKNDKVILNNDNDEKRLLFESCSLKQSRVVNPIIDWSDWDVWDFIKSSKIPYNPLYDEGFSRVGCVGCPLAGKARYKAFTRWPKYKNLYLCAFERMLERLTNCKWKNAEEVFSWWLDENLLSGQVTLDEVTNGL